MNQRVPHCDDHVIVIFGATGDLAKRKLLPGLFHLAATGLMPDDYRVIGSAPAQFAMTDDEFKQHATDAATQFGTMKPEGPVWDTFLSRLSFGAADPDNPQPLLDEVAKADKAIGMEPRRLYHLAIPPSAAPSVINMLGETGLNKGARVICEKPFGTDYASAKALNDTIHKWFDESQVFRIDHFLGKESVDNILALRFSNGLFEPIWNRDHVSSVQIDVPEAISIEGRAAFFEQTGTYRDMIVTHLLQVLGFVAMEPPNTFTGKALRDEKIKVFDAIEPINPKHVVRGQYEGYRAEPGVSPTSDTETFVAMRVEIDNWRWSGVPFYLRSGKSMAQRRQTVTLSFKQPTLRMFPLDSTMTKGGRGNALVVDFDDPGWIALNFFAKEPGSEMTLGRAEMSFKYADSFQMKTGLEGYERMILLAMRGDQALFTRSDGIERLWEVSMPVLDNPPPVELYPPGSWGPKSIDKLISPHHWHLPDGHEGS
jgi:glucose-6-phosphate 1-dehydrogenase